MAESNAYKIVRIFNGCEVLIENSVTRVIVGHHEACQVMPNSYSSDWIFNLHRRIIMDYFSCILFRRQMHLGLTMYCFINFTLKATTFFDQEKFGTAPLLYVDVETFGRKLMWKWRQDVKNDVKIVMHESSYTSCKTSFPSPGWVHGNPGRVCS